MRRTALLVVSVVALGCGDSGSSSSGPASAGPANAVDGGAHPTTPVVASDAGASAASDAGAPTGTNDGGSGSGDAGSGSADGGVGCTQTAPVTLATNLGVAYHLAADDEYIYFIDRGPMTLWRVAKQGGAPQHLADLGTFADGVYAWDYAVDADFIYVMLYGAIVGDYPMQLSPGGVAFYDKSGAEQRSVILDKAAPDDCHVPLMRQLAVADGIVYLDVIQGVANGQCEPTADSVVKLPPRANAGISVGASYDRTGIVGFAATHDGVYWSDARGLWLASAGAGQSQLLGLLMAEPLVAGGSAVYWADDGGVHRGTPAGAMTIATQTLTPMADDGSTLFGTSGAQLARIGNDGTGYAVDGIDASSVTVDDRYVYFVDGSGGTLFRVCK